MLPNGYFETGKSIETQVFFSQYFNICFSGSLFIIIYFLHIKPIQTFPFYDPYPFSCPVFMSYDILLAPYPAYQTLNMGNFFMKGLIISYDRGIRNAVTRQESHRQVRVGMNSLSRTVNI